jgi:YidC/Oxa1 family membrane protein insertase
MILPVALVLSQFISMELMAPPKSEDPAAQSSNAILKVLPLMIGWFSLNVPAALCVYWFANNIITTASSVYIRSSLKAEMATATPGASATATAPAPAQPQTIFAPPREKPSGFAESQPKASRGDGVKTITAVLDAEVVEETKEVPVSASEESSSEVSMKSKKGKKTKKKRKN